VKSTSLQMDSFRGEILVREGEAKLQGRRLPYVPRDSRRVRRPDSGRGGLVPYFWEGLVSWGSVGWLGVGSKNVGIDLRGVEVVVCCTGVRGL